MGNREPFPGLRLRLLAVVAMTDRSRLFLTSDILSREGVRHGFSLRTGGVSIGPFDALNLGAAVGDQPEAVAENLRRFIGTVGVEQDRLATVNQVHGDRVLFARTGERDVRTEAGTVPTGRPEGDAIVAEHGRAAGIRTADCLPVLLYDRRTGLAAAAHAGWRGTVARVVVRTVEAMTRLYGVRPGDLIAAIGPGIGRCCFVVGADVAARFEHDSELGPRVVDKGVESPHVDLPLANRLLLEATGVTTVDVLPLCTSCRRDLFFSHRRDAGQTGRHLAVIEAPWP
jgi:YfiH family protein